MAETSCAVKFCSIVLLFTLLTWGCGDPPRPRPANVPIGAVRIPGPKGMDLWQVCQIDDAEVVRCEVFNVGGKVLSQGVFVPCIGKPPRSLEDLAITPKGGNVWVTLENGAVLVPKESFEEVLEFLVRMRVIASDPRKMSSP
jgi:hypothetical protein